MPAAKASGVLASCGAIITSEPTKLVLQALPTSSADKTSAVFREGNHSESHPQNSFLRLLWAPAAANRPQLLVPAIACQPAKPFLEALLANVPAAKASGVLASCGATITSEPSKLVLQALPTSSADKTSAVFRADKHHSETFTGQPAKPFPEASVGASSCEQTSAFLLLSALPTESLCWRHLQRPAGSQPHM